MSAGAAEVRATRMLKAGLRLIASGIVLIIAVTFFHAHLAAWLDLTGTRESLLIIYGLLAGGVLGCGGILSAVIGYVRCPASVAEAKASLIAVILLVLVFFFLILFPVRKPERHHLSPGETLQVLNEPSCQRELR